MMGLIRLKVFKALLVIKQNFQVGIVQLNCQLRHLMLNFALFHATKASIQLIVFVLTHQVAHLLLMKQEAIICLNRLKYQRLIVRLQVYPNSKAVQLYRCLSSNHQHWKQLRRTVQSDVASVLLMEGSMFRFAISLLFLNLISKFLILDRNLLLFHDFKANCADHPAVPYYKQL